MIVATAGHVDHGKTSLVKALTGIDTDRLPEEKRRGLTIDLGFAYLPIAGRTIGFVDVPGHERFVHNMLAGVAAIDRALLVVAADDGVMPQTREHLAIVELLGVPGGAVALTKVDRVAPERIAAARKEVAALLAGTRLAAAPVFALSSVTGEGVEALKSHLEHEALGLHARKAEGNFRLCVDRSFTIPGAGLVVTGAAVSGAVTLGEEVRTLIGGRSARVRSIHAQNSPAERGSAGERLALNLAGLDKAAIGRGEWIVAGNAPAAVERFDALLRLLPGEELKHWSPVHVHLGAAHATGRIALIERGSNARLVQILLDRALGAVFGDRFVVRDASARRTIGGGRVLDLFPPARGRAKPERLAWLRAMQAEDHEAALEALAAISPEGVDLARFALNRNLPAACGRRFSTEHWAALRAKALAELNAFHERSPESPGMPEHRLARREAFEDLLEELVGEGLVTRAAGVVRLASHRTQIAPADAALWSRVHEILEASGARPPTVAEIAAQSALDVRRLEAALARLARQGLLVRVSKNRFFLPERVRALKDLARAEARSGRPLTAAAFRDRSGLGRNVAIEVLEFFDQIRFTRRVGDARQILNSGPDP